MRLRLVIVLSAVLMCGPALDIIAQATGDRLTAPSPSEVECIDRQSAEPLPLPGPACEKEVFARHGRPFMFPARDGIAYGVSLDSGKPTSLNLWVDNETNETKPIGFCCISTLARHIDIFDSQGHRVLSLDDEIERKAFSEGHEVEEVCSCSGEVDIKPHTMRILDHAALVQLYSLGSGRYIVSERQPPAQRLGQHKHEKAVPPPGLSISIE